MIKKFANYFGGTEFHNEQIKNEVFNGKIVNFYVDVRNHNAYYAVAKNGKNFYVSNSNHIGKIKINDSISKRKGSL